MKRFLLFPLSVCLLLLSACGSSDGMARLPYGSSEYQNEDYTIVESSFRDAGFTNITVKEIHVPPYGKVSSLTVDGSSIFNSGALYDPCVPIVITRRVELVSEPTPLPSPVLSPEPERVYTADAESLQQLAVDMFSFAYDDLSVSWDDMDECYAVSFFPTELARDETTWVYYAVNRYIKYCRVAYTIDGVDRVRFDITASGMDQYGNNVSFLGLSELMTRYDFEKFNWENLSYLGIWDSFNDNCYVFSLAVPFSHSINTENIFYDPHLTRDGMIP